MFKLATHEIDQAREEIRDEQGTVAARIAVGSMPLARTYIVPRAIATGEFSETGILIGSASGATSMHPRPSPRE